MLAIIISYIMAILFLVNLCNALSDFHRISDARDTKSEYDILRFRDSGEEVGLLIPGEVRQEMDSDSVVRIMNKGLCKVSLHLGERKKECVGYYLQNYIPAAYNGNVQSIVAKKSTYIHT